MFLARSRIFEGLALPSADASRGWRRHESGWWSAMWSFKNDLYRWMKVLSAAVLSMRVGAFASVSWHYSSSRPWWEVREPSVSSNIGLGTTWQTYVHIELHRYWDWQLPPFTLPLTFIIRSRPWTSSFEHNGIDTSAKRKWECQRPHSSESSHTRVSPHRAPAQNAYKSSMKRRTSR